MSLKIIDSLLQDNLRLQGEKEAANKKLTDLIFVVENKLSKMIELLEEIKNKEVIVNQVQQVSEKQEVRKLIVKNEPSKIFIPTPDSSSLKSNISDPEKKTRKADIDGSLEQLSKLQDNLNK